jgi:hypothetical protein
MQRGKYASKLTLDQIAADQTARTVTPQEAAELERRNREIAAQERTARAQAAQERKARVQARAAKVAARQAELAPVVARILALEPGRSCTVPAKEFAAVYRVALREGRRLHTKRLELGVLLVSRDAADGLF